MAKLGVVPAADPRGQLHHLRPVGAEEDLRVRGAVLHPEGGRSRPRRLDGGLDVVRARPGVRQRDAESGNVRRQPVGDRERLELALRGKRVHGHLGPVDELLDQGGAAAGGSHRVLDRERESFRLADERQSLLALAVRRLDHGGHRQVAGVGRHHSPARLGDAGLLEAFPLSLLRHGQGCGLRGNGVRQPETSGDPSGDRDRPVDARGDYAVDLLCGREHADRRLVLGRDDGAAVCVLEPGGLGIPVAGDDVEPSRAGRAQDSELGRAGP